MKTLSTIEGFKTLNNDLQMFHRSDTVLKVKEDISYNLFNQPIEDIEIKALTEVAGIAVAVCADGLAHTVNFPGTFTNYCT